MLNRVDLKGFKLHRDTSLELAPITVFIGPNNSGKSSIFQALLALRQACEADPPRTMFLAPAQRQPTSDGKPFLFPLNQLIDIGDFADVVRLDHSAVTIGVSGSVRSAGLCSDIGVSFKVEIEQNTLVGHEGRLNSPYGRSEWKYAGGAPEILPALREELDPQVELWTAKLQLSETFQLLHPGLVEFHGIGGWEKPREVAPALASTPRDLLRSLRPVHPLRGLEEWGAPLPQQRADSIERLVLPDRAIALSSLLTSDLKLRREVSERLEELVGIGIDFETIGNSRVKLYAIPTGQRAAQTLLANEGTGANQLAFILVPLGLANPGETILLAEPEVHLHPKMQSELAGLLLTIADKQRLQLVIETHSEHVLHRLLHAVASGELKRDDLAIHYFENQDGVAKVQRLQVNDLGQVEGGLPGFFDQSLAELSEYLAALKKA